MALKVVLLEKRAPAFDLTAFHCALVEAARNSVPSQGCRRYVQSQTLPQGYRRGELPFDAVEEMWFDDRADALAWLHLAGRDRRSRSLGKRSISRSRRFLRSALDRP